MQAAKQNLKIQFYVTSLSVILFVLKFVAYFMTHSLSVLSDALESIVNVLAGGIGLYSLYVASKPKDKEHPYGHGKAEFISAAFEGSLIIAAGLIIFYESINAIFKPSELHSLDNGFGIVLLTNITGIDAVLAILMSFWIIYNGYKIIRASLAGIMDEADLALLEEVVGELNKNRNVQWVDLHNLRVIKYGSLMHIDCHLTVPWFLNVNEAHQVVEEFTSLIKNKFGASIEFFVHTDGCMSYSCPICLAENCAQRKAPFEQKLDWTIENVLSDLKHQL